MKVETRGKYPGVKLHLDPEDIAAILEIEESLEDSINYMKDELSEVALKTLRKMIKKLKELKESTPDLLQERTPEQIAAILAKEAEAATLKLDRLKAGKDWKKLDPAKLQDALLKHVK